MPSFSGQQPQRKVLMCQIHVVLVYASETLSSRNGCEKGKVCAVKKSVSAQGDGEGSGARTGVGRSSKS